jgi:hypothetical protein
MAEKALVTLIQKAIQPWLRNFVAAHRGKTQSCE